MKPECFRRIRIPSYYTFDNYKDVLKYIKNLKTEPIEHIVIFCFDIIMSVVKAYYIENKSSEFDAYLNIKDVGKVIADKDVDALLLVHNHPNDNIGQPSKEDIDLTQTFYHLCKGLNIDFLDHFIIYGDNVCSLKELNLLNLDETVDEAYERIEQLYEQKHQQDMDKRLDNMEKMVANIKKTIKLIYPKVISKAAKNKLKIHRKEICNKQI